MELGPCSQIPRNICLIGPETLATALTLLSLVRYLLPGLPKHFPLAPICPHSHLLKKKLPWIAIYSNVRPLNSFQEKTKESCKWVRAHNFMVTAENCLNTVEEKSKTQAKYSKMPEYCLRSKLWRLKENIKRAHDSCRKKYRV